MEKVSSEEKKNRRTGMITSIGIHVVLFILFFFLLAWSEPDPPIPQYGIELSFVQSNSTGKVESEVQNESEQETPQESENAEEQEESPAEEIIEEEVLEQPVESEDTETTEEPIEEAVDQVEEVEESEVVETEDVNSPDISEEVEEIKETEKVEQEENKVEEPVENSKEEVKEGSGDSDETAEKQVIDSRAIYSRSSGEGKASSASGGASLDLSGWLWDFVPEPDDESEENGKIVFQIIVDGEGEIIGIKTLEKTVSPAVERVYKDAVMDLTFSKTSENRSVAATSTGKITFIIQSR